MERPQGIFNMTPKEFVAYNDGRKMKIRESMAVITKRHSFPPFPSSEL